MSFFLFFTDLGLIISNLRSIYAFLYIFPFSILQSVILLFPIFLKCSNCILDVYITAADNQKAKKEKRKLQNETSHLSTRVTYM